MEEEGKAILAVLQTLARRGLQQHRELGLQFGDRLPKDARNNKLVVMAHSYLTLTERELSDMANVAERQQFPKDTFIPLEPSNYTKGGFAFLWCRWDLPGSNACGFYYGHFRMAPRQQVEGELTGGNVPQFIGYRYESPNPGGDEHRFFHAQPTDSMDPAADRIACALPCPVDAPTFPLPVQTIVGLLLCLVLSVLGKKRLDEIIAELRTSRQTQRNSYLNNAITEVLAIAV